MAELPALDSEVRQLVDRRKPGVDRVNINFPFAHDADDRCMCLRAAPPDVQVRNPRIAWLLDQFAHFVRDMLLEIGSATVCTPVTNAHLVCRPLLEKKNLYIIKHKQH